MVNKLKKFLVKEGFSFKSIVAFIVFGIIVLVFVLFGFPSNQMGSGDGGGYAARVNDKYISMADLKEEISRREQYFQKLGGMFGGSQGKDRMKQDAIGALVQRELLNQSAKKTGIDVADSEVREFITKEIPFLQDSGKFQKEAYRRFLDATGQSAGQFEDKVRLDLRSQRSVRLFEAVGSPSQIEIEKEASLKEFKVNVSFIKMEREKIFSQINLGNDEIKAKLADEAFQTRVKNDYQANKTQFETPEEIKASHILIRIDENTLEPAAQAKMKVIEKRAQSEDFGKLAAEVSEDPGSKAKKGDLGYFRHGMMTPEFDKAAFNTPVGKMSGLIKTDYGYHLIKVMDRKAAKTTPLEEAQNGIAKKLILSDKFETELKQLEDKLAQGDSAQIDAFVANWKLSWDETGPTDLSQDFIPKLGSATASQAALEVSEKAPLLKRIVRDGEAKYLMKWKSATKEVVKTEVANRDQLGKYRSYDLLMKWIENEKKFAKIETNLPISQGPQSDGPPE